MKYFLAISNFLEEISSLSHVIVFPYFFALITEKAFLSLLAILWNSASKRVYLSFSPLLFASLLFILLCFSLLFFSQLFVRPPQTAILLFAFLFHGDGLDPYLLYSVTNLRP